jgi:hypothetical protein
MLMGAVADIAGSLPLAAAMSPALAGRTAIDMAIRTARIGRSIFTVYLLGMLYGVAGGRVKSPGQGDNSAEGERRILTSPRRRR